MAVLAAETFLFRMMVRLRWLILGDSGLMAVNALEYPLIRYTSKVVISR
jgi:hypothetical protein